MFHKHQVKFILISFFDAIHGPRWDASFWGVTSVEIFCLSMSHKKEARLEWVNIRFQLHTF